MGLALEPLVPGNVDEKEIESLGEASKYLAEKNAVGILIGGKAYACMAGHSSVEVQQRKDTDIMVIDGGSGIDHEDTNLDFFLPSLEGAFKNRTGFALSYHIHYMGEPLEPGLYLSPHEVVLLTESEMATRKSADRVVQEVIESQYQENEVGLPQVPAKDVVIEFPGDFSWFSEASFSFPVNIIVREGEDGLKRTFISFSPRPASAYPATAFPNPEDIMCPDLPEGTQDVFPENVLTDEDVSEIVQVLIEGEHYESALGFAERKAPYLANNLMFIEDHKNTEESPIRAARVVYKWIEMAREHKFLALLLLARGDKMGIGYGYRKTCEKGIRELADNILKKYGGRKVYLDLAQRLKAFSFESLISDEEARDMIVHNREVLNTWYLQGEEEKKSLRYSITSNPPYAVSRFDPSVKRDDSPPMETAEYGGVILKDRIIAPAESEYYFTDDFYETCELLGITEEELSVRIRPEFTEKHQLFNQILEEYFEGKLPVFSKKKIFKGGDKTVKDVMNELYTTEGMVYQLIGAIRFNFPSEMRDQNVYATGSFMQQLAQICNIADIQSFREMIKANCPETGSRRVREFFDIN